MTTTNLCSPLLPFVATLALVTRRCIAHFVIAFAFAAAGSSTARAWQFENMYASGGRSGLHYGNGQYRTSNGSTVAIGASDNTPLNMFFSFGIHNAYAKKNTNLYNILKNVSPQIELDIMDVNILASPFSGDWRVAHEPTASSYANCSRDINAAEVANLSDCLEAVLRFHDDFPLHDLISIWIELKSPKESWSSKPSKTPAALDSMIGAMFSNSDLYRPVDLKGSYSTLRDAAQAGNWKTMGSLKGKIMFILFSPEDDDNSKLDHYATNRGSSAKAFIAPHVRWNGTSTGSVEYPGGMSTAGANWAVMFDLKGSSYEDHSHGLRIAKYNYIASTYYVNSQATPAISEYRDFFIQQGRIDETAWSSTTYAYSGRLNIEERRRSSECFGCGDHVPMVAQIHLPYLAGTKCVAIEGNGISDRGNMVIETCNPFVSSQWFSFVDAAIDYQSSPATPSSRAYIIQPVNRSGSMTPNEKVMEVQGECCGNQGSGRRIFQYTREETASRDRAEDQHWRIKFGTWPNLLLYPAHDSTVCFEQETTTYAQTGPCSHTNSEQVIELIPVSLY